MLEGNWPARKIGRQWQGSWRARTTLGQSFFGNWDADLPESMDQTFGVLLKRTIEKQVAGFWQSGGNRGNWWSTGLTAKKGH